MSWMSKFFAPMRGMSSFAFPSHALVQRVVDRVEPEIWGLVHEGIAGLTSGEVRGYVWARAALPVARAMDELGQGARGRTRARAAIESRAAVAERIVEQMRLTRLRAQARRAA
jgi:hypothetical protein